MSAENPTVALVAIDQGTLNFAQAVQSWDGQGTAPFSTAQVQYLAGVLCNQNLLKAFKTGRAASDALTTIRAEIPRLETELKDKKPNSIQQQTEIAGLTRSLDLVLDAVTAQRRARWRKAVEAGCQGPPAREVPKAVKAGSTRARWRRRWKPVVGRRGGEGSGSR